MKYGSAAALIAGLSLASAGPVPRQPIRAREVPQEHSHNAFLDLVRTSLNTNNPKGIQDPVFGLLGNAAAAAGAGQVTNLDCLQQETADQAFTNAKAAGDIPGMAGALLYRSIERNTGKVGLASVICNETAANPEIDALSQHQDPASTDAATTNKAITLELAKQLAAIGADPLLALESGTFAPGDLNDATAKGNSCDTEDDEPGCIFSQNLLVLDATEAEISAAVAGITPTVTGTGVISATDVDFAGLAVATGASVAVATDAAAATTTDAAASATDSADATDASECTFATVTVTAASSGSSCSVITTTVAASVASSLSASATASAAVATSTADAATGTDVQKFTGTLGAAAPPIISSASDRPFSVNGNTFVNLAAAVQRSCDVQRNACFNAANAGTLSGGTAQCDTQASECSAANSAATKRQASDFGTCGDPTILFETGLDGRNTAAFIAEDQTDYNHGSALNIAVIAGFICQRLGSPCNAPADVQASCTSASAAAVATTQDQGAADVFNSILGVGGAASAVATDAAAATTTAAADEAAATATATESSVVMTITQCS
ncbi:Ribosomal protein s17 [Pleurostoma richardsiae]|uniref:Ribosomal protein s17 n=1 Tax=Pleurostoma richardsiae TaxID=41990 RepID=A0AA38RGC7_9PEZI|nr:Ribosomal protein s17 [Pleurostoma richardsiae]